ncbi:MAG: hypothetical protein ACLTML_19985 [Blautia faecis]
MAQLDKKFDGGHGDVLETSAMMAIAPESVHLELSKPINAQDPSENMKAAYIQAVNFKGGIVRLVRDTKEIAQAAGLDLLIRKILPQNLDRRPLIWQYPISVIFWKK